MLTPLLSLYSYDLALQAVTKINAHLKAAREELLLFQRGKGHVALGYADSTEGLRQCVSEHFGRSLSWFYRRAQEARIIELSPACENLSGRALRQLSRASEVGVETVLELAASTGRLTESTIQHAAAVLHETLICGTVPDGEGGQVSVKKALEQGVQNSLREASIRHNEAPLFQGEARVTACYTEDGCTTLTLVLQASELAPLIPAQLFVSLYPR